ncbi:40283_t:CDS:2, partial [Gigaspora margarita]
KVEMLARRLEEQTIEVEMLKEKVRRLEERTKNNGVDGDKYNQYNRETTRVLELKDDHTARNYAIRSDLDELRNENKQLLLKLEELQKKAQKYKNLFNVR